MLPIIPFLQDVAGVNCPIAPFAMSTSKNIYYILCRIYNSDGELVQLFTLDYSSTQGRVLEEKRFCSCQNYSIEGYLYDKKDVVKTYRLAQYIKNDMYAGRYVMQNRLRYKEVYDNGFLSLRQNTKATQIESYKYSIENYTIHKEFRDERSGTLYLGDEQYYKDRRILVQHRRHINLSNLDEIISDETYEYCYSGNCISHIICQIKSADSIQRTRLEYQQLDDRLNPLIIQEYSEEGENALLYTKAYEYAYDEATAEVLKVKFDSHKKIIW